MSKLIQYYNNKEKYLQEHASFFKSSNIKKDVDFIIKALNIKKKDDILDIACGQGRHTNQLLKNNYKVKGLDFSKFLLTIASNDAKKLGFTEKIYFHSNVQNIKIKNKFNKAYWFFTDLAEIDIQKAVQSISKTITRNGLLLIDTDNIFRLIKFLNKTNNSNFSFDANKLILIDKKNKVQIQYPVLPMWEDYFNKSKMKIVKVYGDYNLKPYTISSSRLIIVAKKIA